MEWIDLRKAILRTLIISVILLSIAFTSYAVHVPEISDKLIAEGATWLKNDFEFENWGSYIGIGFLTDKYFAGYVDTLETEDDILFEESDDENVLANNQLLKILIDKDEELTVTSSVPYALEDGYQLAIKFIEIDGNRVYLELTKDGSVVDTKFISPSKDGATMKDKTYYYKKNIGNSKDVIVIAVHFKNAFRGSDQDLATIDGIWQLSDTATNANDLYDFETIEGALEEPVPEIDASDIGPIYTEHPGLVSPIVRREIELEKKINKLKEEGNAYFRQRLYDDAILKFTSAISICPREHSADLYYNRGRVYFEMESFVEAIGDLNAALEINPNYEKAQQLKRIALQRPTR